jgi:hypothetical protein
VGCTVKGVGLGGDFQEQREQMAGANFRHVHQRHQVEIDLRQPSKQIYRLLGTAGTRLSVNSIVALRQCMSKFQGLSHVSDVLNY